MATQKKIDQVNEIKTKLEKAKAVILADPSGLTHKQLEELRRALKKTKAEFTVIKNTLLKRAFSENNMSVDAESLNGSTASLLAFEDEASPVKALTEFFKTAGIGKIKTGLLGTRIITSAEIEQLAKLPSRDMLLAKLVGQLQAPISGLHNALSWNIRKLVWTLDGIKSKKQ